MPEPDVDNDEPPPIDDSPGEPDSADREPGTPAGMAEGPGRADRLLYTPEQAAALLQVPASWLRKKAAAKVVPHTRIGRHLRFSPADLDAIIRHGQRHPTPYGN